MGIMNFVNVWAFHAFHFPRKSNQDGVEDNPFPIAEDSEGTVIHPWPIPIKRNRNSLSFKLCNLSTPRNECVCMFSV